MQRVYFVLYQGFDHGVFSHQTCLCFLNKRIAGETVQSLLFRQTSSELPADVVGDALLFQSFKLWKSCVFIPRF